MFEFMSGQIFLGRNSTKQRIKCLAQGHKAVPPVAVWQQLELVSCLQMTASHYAPLSGVNRDEYRLMIFTPLINRLGQPFFFSELLDKC